MELERLLAVPGPRLEMIGRSLGRRWSAERSREAVDCARTIRSRDVRSGLDWAQLAAGLAEASGDRGARARARLELGNALRLADRLPESAAALRRAARLVDGAAPPAQRIDLLSYRTALALDRGDWRQAIRLATEGVGLASADDVLRFSVHLANGHKMAGQAHAAAAIEWRIVQAAEQLDHQRFAHGCLDGLNASLMQAGELDAADRGIEASRALWRLRPGTPSETLLRHWMSALVRYAQERRPSALDDLLTVRTGLLEVDQPIYAMAVGIDTLYLLAWSGRRPGFDALLAELVTAPSERLPDEVGGLLRRLQGEPPAALQQATPRLLRLLGTHPSVLGATHPVAGPSPWPRRLASL